MNLLRLVLLTVICVVCGSCASSYVAPSPSTASAKLRIAVPQSETFASVGIRAYPLDVVSPP
jgi:hypothetical protein